MKYKIEECSTQVEDACTRSPVVEKSAVTRHLPSRRVKASKQIWGTRMGVFFIVRTSKPDTLFVERAFTPTLHSAEERTHPENSEGMLHGLIMNAVFE